MYLKYENQKPFSDLVGKTLVSITGLEKGSDEVIFTVDDGTVYVMLHRQDCCESVDIEDVCGDVEDLIGSPILVAEEVRSSEDENPLAPAGWKIGSCESATWTFYKIDTAKGGMTIRWYGSSNGYYSESVDFGIASDSRW